ncbi:Uncharacterised protein [uncultured archaeon]|nr:Uncharacterised protein [uncultured archaeon]
MKNMEKKSIILLLNIMLVGTILIPMVNAQSSPTYFTKSPINKIIEQKDNGIATVYTEHYDAYAKKIIREPIMELNKQDAEIIKQQLVNVDKSNLPNQEKIKEQMSILHKWKILPENITYEDFEIVLNRMINIKQNHTNPLITPGFIMTGPAITSTLALGGDIFPIELLLGNLVGYFFDIQIFNRTMSGLLNGTHLDAGIIAGPVYVGFGPTLAFIVIVGPSTQGFFKVLLSPFIDIKVLFAGVHFTVSIFENSSAVTLFDWHINVALMGVITYL